MLMLTELKAKTRLSKVIVDAQTTKSYPLVKEVTSKDYIVDTSSDLEEFEDAIRTIADRGGCLLKGPLLQHLNHESRSGKCDKFAPTRWMVIDIDGMLLPNVSVKPPLSKYELRVAAEEAIKLLPDCFHDVSYVVQASSSLGMKGARVSMHLFFVLDAPIKPSALKVYTKLINLSNPKIEANLELSATGYSLRWPLDPSVADNSKLIFVAPPVFKDPKLDPFTSAGERIVRVEKGRVDVRISNEVEKISDVEKITRQINMKRNSLRKAMGMTDTREKFTTKRFGGERIEVLSNPDQMNIEVVDDVHLPYVRCNINGGDSGGYYFLITNPEYMRNFKDEPYFSIKAASPAFYEKIIEHYGPQMESFRGGRRPVVFRDYYTNKLYNAVYDSDENAFDPDYPITGTDWKSIPGFMEAHGHSPPDVVPEARVVFDPKSNEAKVNLDVVPYFINQYSPTQYILRPSKCKAHAISTVHELSTKCPNIYTLITHVCGSDLDDAGRFINWLAYIYQRRDKTGVSWLVGGTQGTGKGVLLNRVIKPLFGHAHVPSKTLESMEEKYNAYMQTALIVAVDEFRIHNTTTGASRMMDKLKNLITEPTMSIRGMRAEQVEVPSYSNFIFMTNHPDAMKLEEGDRRFNVAAPQYERLVDAHPDLVYNLDVLGEELSMFAGFLNTFEVDIKLATTAFENKAKKLMKEANIGFREQFINSVAGGEIQNFEDIMAMSTSDTFNAGRIIEAQNTVRAWAESVVNGDKAIIPVDRLRGLYNLMTDEARPISIHAFSRMLAAGSITATRVYVQEEGKRKQKRGIAVPFRIDAGDIPSYSFRSAQAILDKLPETEDATDTKKAS